MSILLVELGQLIKSPGEVTPEKIQRVTSVSTGLTGAPFSRVICASSCAALLDSAALAALASKVSPGGTLEIREVIAVTEGAALGVSPRLQTMRSAESLRKALLLAGLMPQGVLASAPLEEQQLESTMRDIFPELSTAALGGSAESRDALSALSTMLAPKLELATLSSSKPQYVPGASFSLRSRNKVTAPKPPKPAAVSAWTLAVDSSADTELIDEDELLMEEDKKVKDPKECGTLTDGKRKACANCSCGLREILENGEEVPVVKSSCGSCGLGDAFRCAGCPHLGKPAFDTDNGSGVKLADAMFSTGGQVDVSPAGEQAVAPTAKGTAVKLSLDDMSDAIF